jgi:hypothetical protein
MFQRHFQIPIFSTDKIEQEVTTSMMSEEVTSPNYEMMMSARNVVMSYEHK